MAAKRFLSGMNDRVMAQQLLAARVTDTVQLVDRTSAMAAAAGAGEHSRSRRKKDSQRDDFNIVAAQSTLIPSEQRQSGNEQPDVEQKFDDEQTTDQFDAFGNLRRRPQIRVKGPPGSCFNCGKPKHLARDCPSLRVYAPSGSSSRHPPTDPRKCPFIDGSHHLEQCA